MTLCLGLRKGLQDEEVPPLSQGHEVNGTALVWPGVDTSVRPPMVQCKVPEGPTAQTAPDRQRNCNSCVQIPFTGLRPQASRSGYAQVPQWDWGGSQKHVSFHCKEVAGSSHPGRSHRKAWM